MDGRSVATGAKWEVGWGGVLETFSTREGEREPHGLVGKSSGNRRGAWVRIHWLPELSQGVLGLYQLSHGVSVTLFAPATSFVTVRCPPFTSAYRNENFLPSFFSVEREEERRKEEFIFY